MYGAYRYGFNGKEMDNEVSGSGNQYDYGFRIYNPRIGRFLSVDPLCKSFPWYTPYQFAGNMPIWAIDLDGLEEMKANSVAHVIKDINGNIITKPTLVRDSNPYSDRIPGVQRIDANHIEVTPGLIEKDHPYWNTFTWQQVNGKDFYTIQSITQIGHEAGGTIKPPKTSLQQDNDDVPPVTNKPTTVIAPINSTQVRNQTITQNINFVSGSAEFATDADRQILNQVAGQAPNSTTTGRPRTQTNGNTTTTTTTTTQVRSIITIDLRTDLREHDYSRNLQTNRYNLMRQQLIDSGVPARNIRRGATQYNQTQESMGGRTNQTIFRIRTSTSRTRAGTSTTTE
jgi:RHS repeat-associated protein